VLINVRGGRTEVDEGHDYYEHVKPIPAALHKFAEPIGEKVEEELDGEDSSEHMIDAAYEVFEAHEVVRLVLRVDNADEEVL
jgi:hypothetical protein